MVKKMTQYPYQDPRIFEDFSFKSFSWINLGKYTLIVNRRVLKNTGATRLKITFKDKNINLHQKDKGVNLSLELHLPS